MRRSLNEIRKYMALAKPKGGYVLFMFDTSNVCCVMYELSHEQRTDVVIESLKKMIAELESKAEQIIPAE